MARETITRTVCDVCRSTKDVEARRVGDWTRLFKFELCKDHRETIDDLPALRTGSAGRRRLTVTTMEEVERQRLT